MVAPQKTRSINCRYRRAVAIAIIAIAIFPSAGAASAPRPRVDVGFVALAAPGAKRSRRPRETSTGFASSIVLAASPEGEDPRADGDPSSEGGAGSRRRGTVARAGGRRPRNDRRLRDDVVQGGGSSGDADDAFAVVRRWALPALLLAIVLRLWSSLFGGGDPNVVYYSRSVYQSTTYARDGTVETTTRKEDVRSNVPGLFERAKRGGGDPGYSDPIDAQLADLEDEVDSLLFNRW